MNICRDVLHFYASPKYKVVNRAFREKTKFSTYHKVTIWVITAIVFKYT
jgi:hypothetical protein